MRLIHDILFSSIGLIESKMHALTPKTKDAVNERSVYAGRHRIVHYLHEKYLYIYCYSSPNQ